MERIVTMPLLHVACIQMRSSDDVSANILAASSLIREAKEGGAELIATPEMTSLLDRRPGALLEKTVPEPLDQRSLHSLFSHKSCVYGS